MPKHIDPIFWNSIQIVVDGVEVTGTYSIDSKDWMTVRMDGGGSTQSYGGPAADSTARLILSELFLSSKQPAQRAPQSKKGFPFRRLGQ